MGEALEQHGHEVQYFGMEHEFEPNEWVASYIEARINSDDTMADKAEVFYTHCLKEFPFPEYSGEKFLGEDIVWIRIRKC